MTIVTPVPERPFVTDAGILTREGRDFLQGVLDRTGGAGTVILTQAEIVGSVVNELVKFTADGNLTNSAVMSSTGDVAATGDVTGTGLIVRQTKLVNFSDVSGANEVVFVITPGEEYQVTDIFLSGDGTDFSGGDRDLEVSQGTSIYSVIPAATLQSLATSRWGSVGVPFPVDPAHLLTNATGSISVEYSGGTSDYTAGQCTIVILAERVI